MKDIEKIELREMAKSDAEFVLEIRNDDSTRFFLHNSDPFTLKQFNMWFEYESPYWFIVSRGGVPFGYMRTDYVDKISKKIQVGMDIHPKFRGQGLARPSFLKLFDFLKSNGFQKVWLEVLEKNKLAHSIYLKLGFVEIDRIIIGELDSVVMEREL